MCDKKVKTIPQRLEDLEVDLQDSIKKIIKKEGYLEYDLKVSKLNTQGSSYLGNLYGIDIRGVVGDEKKETNIFAKVILYLEKIDIFSVEDLYLNEVFVYKELLRIFQYLQDEAEVPLTERFNFARSFDQTSPKTILLENLNRKGFKMYNRLDVMSLEFAELSVQQLARFNGLSFVTEKKMPEFFNKRIKTLKHHINYNDDFRKNATRNSKYTINLFEGEERRRVERFASSITDKIMKYNLDKSCKCCLLHGDFKISNILAREEEGVAVEVVPVDYQLLDYGCPIRDFVFFIFTGTDQDFRRKHLNYLKDLYYETLTDFLKYFDINAEDVYSRKEFERIYAEWLDYGLLIVMMGTTFLFAPEEGFDVETISLSEMEFQPGPVFEERARGWIDDFMKWGYL